MACCGFHSKAAETPPPEDPTRVPVIFSRLSDAHDAQIDQLEASTREALVKVYNRLKPELVAKLKALDAAGKGETFTAQHMALMTHQIEAALAAAREPLCAVLTEGTGKAVAFGSSSMLADVVDLEKRFGDVAQAMRVAQLSPVIPAKRVAQLADDQQLLLKKFADEALHGATVDGQQLPGIAAKLAESEALGESIPKAAKRLAGALDAERWKLRRIARTELNNAANVGHDAQITAVATDFPEMELYKQWSSHRDTRTTPECRYLDGQVRAVGQNFEAPGWSGQHPPVKPNCRSRENAYSKRWSGKKPRSDEQIAADEAAWLAEHRKEKSMALNRKQRRAQAKSGLTELKAPNGAKMFRQAFEFKADQVGEDGTFEGYLSVFNVQDHGDDVVVKGAFLKTLRKKAASGRWFPTLWYHDPTEPIGKFLELREDDHGLFVKGQLNLEVQSAREKHALLKQGAVDSMSIGYSVPKGGSEYKDGKRFLKEIDLWEGSLVTFAMNEAALVTDVKAADWATVRDFEQRDWASWTERWQLFDSITSYICSLLVERETLREEKLAAFDTSMEQFHDELRDWFERALDLEEQERDAGVKGDEPDEAKAGRRHSAATLEAIGKAHGMGQELCAMLKALMPADATDEGEEADDEEPKGATPPAPPAPSAELKDFSNFLATFQTSLAIGEMKRSL